MMSEVKRYRKKALEVEALEWTGTNLDALRAFAGDENLTCSGSRYSDLSVWNDQEHDWIKVPFGHSIVKGKLGELYPISQAAIAETYEATSERPAVVCLCGSTRFFDAFRSANLRLTLAGEIVLSIGCDTKSDADLGIVAGDLAPAKAMLDELHKRKIDLADYVLVVSDPSGYFGDSTRSEIAYAVKNGKPVEFTNSASRRRAYELELI